MSKTITIINGKFMLYNQHFFVTISKSLLTSVRDVKRNKKIEKVA